MRAHSVGLAQAGLLAVCLVALATPASAWLLLPNLLSASPIDDIRASLTTRVLQVLLGSSDGGSIFEASTSPPANTLSFNVQGVRHHSTHPDYTGHSASYTVVDSDADIRGSGGFGPVYTKIQTVRRLANPRAYLASRSQLVALARVTGSGSQVKSTAATIDALQSLHAMLQWEDVDLVVPDVSRRATLLALAKMSASAYDPPPDPPTWEPGFEGWNLTESFGWVENGIRGHIFSSDPDNSTIVVALKGTSAGILPGGDDTGRRDKLNDNLLFSCCCARVSWTWSPVCPCPFSSSTCSQPCLERSLLTESVYYPLITDLYNNISYAYPRSQIWVTGHSLGGALSSLIAMTFGIPAVTFEAPAERMAARRLHLPVPPRLPKQLLADGKSLGTTASVPRLPITHVFHTADPIPMGTCTGSASLCGSAGYAMESKCHAGDVIVYNTTGLLGWRENIATHRIATLVDDLLTSDWGDRVRKQSKKSAVLATSTEMIADVMAKSLVHAWRWPWKGGKGADDDADDDDGLGNIGETPVLADQRHCQDCDTWDFVDRDKTK